MPSCPACRSFNFTAVRAIDSSEAAQHFALREREPERYRYLRDRIRDLWKQNGCDINRCDDCGFHYSWPFVAGDEFFYELAFPEAGYPTDRWEYGRTIAALSGSAIGNALEIGAGRGYFLDQLGVKATALEYNEASRQTLRDKGHHVAVELTDVQEERFDNVFMFQVLEHMDNIDSAIALIATVSRGSVFVSVPNPERIAFNEAHGSLLDMPPNHIGRWTRQALEAAWGRHGFRLVAFERERESLLSLARLDLCYRVLRLAQDGYHLPRLAVAAMRVPVWLLAASRMGDLGATVWAHFVTRGYPI